VTSATESPGRDSVPEQGTLKTSANRVFDQPREVMNGSQSKAEESIPNPSRYQGSNIRVLTCLTIRNNGSRNNSRIRTFQNLIMDGTLLGRIVPSNSQHTLIIPR